MRNIVPEVSSLNQYRVSQKNPGLLRPSSCPYCGKAGLHCHGCYYRKADRANLATYVLVMIFRFLCPTCSKTCSVLPECIPPRRWYLWNDFQQVAIASVLMGKSFATAAKEAATKKIEDKKITLSLSRHTVSRWFNQLHQKFDTHSDVLCQRIVSLGRFNKFEDFWLACFAKISLSEAMLLCNGAGVNVP